MILHLIVGILTLGDPCVEEGLLEKQCEALGIRVSTPGLWLTRFTKPQTIPMTIVLVITMLYGLCKVLLHGTIKKKFESVSIAFVVVWSVSFVNVF